MAVLAVVTDVGHVKDVIQWAARFASAQEAELHILCWAYSPTAQFPLLAEADDTTQLQPLLDTVRSLVSPDESEPSPGLPVAAEQTHIHTALEPDMVKAVMAGVRRDDIKLLVAMNDNTVSENRRSDRADALLRQSPCDTVILFRGRQKKGPLTRIFVGTSSHVTDVTTTSLAAKISSKMGVQVNIARVEDDPGQNAVEVGRRELRDLMKEASIRRTELIKHKVFLEDQNVELFAAANKADLVLVGANSRWPLREMLAGTTRPAIGVVRRAPPLRGFGSRLGFHWLSPLTPATYADLIQGLRRDSNISEDFLMMLGLAAAIASLGLLQDSPVVVIGSMLLAPLMTPMIGCGLATAQANPTLGRISLKTIFIGFLLTLATSAIVGWITPGSELTAQILSRGNPNILDLLLALLSGAAAAYALARPNIVGAVAGVAIATALVPPLCSSGISLAYGEFQNAIGASLLFVTNVVAIILSAAGTFRILGVTSLKATAWQRRWVVRIVSVLGVIVIGLSYPLELALENSLLEGKPIPNTHPLSQVVHNAVVDEIEKLDGVQLIAAGRPGSVYNSADVVLIISAPAFVDSSLGDRLIEIVKQKMNDDEINVVVHCLQNYWHESNAEELPESGDAQ